MDNTVIKVEDVCKNYRLYKKSSDRVKEALSIRRKSYSTEFKALDDISFKVDRGECFGIIGENGSGKSTLLKIITGVLSPSSGSCQVSGKVSALLELGAGFNVEYTGRENVYVNGMMLGYSRHEMDEKLEAILEFADIGEFIDQPVKLYSSGMFVRLAFAVAINVDPDVLIIDEALSVGDVFFQNKCFKKFDEFKQNGKTILIVTHDMGGILKYCKNAMFLKNGKVEKIGPSREVVDAYKKSKADELDGGRNAVSKTEEAITLPENAENMKSSYYLNPATTEYGNKNAEIIDFGYLNFDGKVSNTFETNEKCKLRMVVKFNETVKEPIFAFAIKDIKGIEITGTNTLLEGISYDFIEKGRVVSIEFEHFMIMQGGPYLVSLGCTRIVENGEVEVMHRLYDVFSFEIIHTKVATGYFNLNSKVDVKFIS